MTLDPNASRQVVSYVRVGRGMVKVTKYENEQPKSPSDTLSIASRSSSGRSSSDRSASTLGPPTRGWLRSRAKGSSKRAASAHRHRSRSRSSARSLQAIRRPGGYMRSEQDVSSSQVPGDATTPGRRGSLKPQGRLPLDSLPVPGSLRPRELSYDKESNYPKFTPCLSSERGRGRGFHISPPLATLAASHPSPSIHSWTTESEVNPATDAEMWAHITRLEDELVSRFGRGAVPQFSSLRTEKSSTPPAGGKRDLEPALPDELLAALQRKPPGSAKLKQRSFEPIHLAEPPRRVHRTKSSPTLAFPLPPTVPNWVTQAPLPSPQGLVPSSATMRAKAGPPPPFAPPPDFPPPPPPLLFRNTGPKVLDEAGDEEAMEALYHVLLERTANSRSEIGKPAGHDTLRPEETERNYFGFNEPRRSRARTSAISRAEEDERTPPARGTDTI